MQISARRVQLSIAAAAAAVLAVLAGGASPASAAEETCPNTFHVLHNDHIGKLDLPEGHYTITLLDDSRPLNCQKAATLFTKFLEDFNGKLPGRWEVRPNRSEFERGNSGVGFRVTQGSHTGGGGGHHPAGSGKRCPGTFQVQHNDRIGKLKLPAGPYRMWVLTDSNPNCSKASQLFARFLQDPSGNLPGKWNLQVRSATFTRRNTPNGFRVKPAP